MSLINEALKRARAEAERQQEESREGGTGPAWTPPPFRREERSSLLVTVGVSLAVSLVVGTGFYVLRGRAAQSARSNPATTAPATAASGPSTLATRTDLAASATPSPATPLTAPAAPAPTAVAPAASSVPAPAQAAATPPGARAGEATTARHDRETEPVATPASRAASVQGDTATTSRRRAAAASDEPTAASVASSATASRDETQPPARATRHGQLDGRVLASPITLPDGGRLELGGVISGAVPLVMLNGRMIGIGEFAGDYVVAKIEPKRVELRGPEGAFWLSLP